MAYTSRDPIGFEGGINLYAYAGASPSRHTDPTGEIIPCLLMNYARCMVACVGEDMAMDFVFGCGDREWGDAIKDCAKSCLWSMLPIPDPCGKFGKLFGAAVGLASGLMNSFPADTPVHTRIQTDSGYQTQLKRIADIQVGDEVLAWDELAAHDQSLTQQSYQKVTEVYNTPERIRTLVHLTLDNGQTLTATDGHPFKTEEGWRDAVLLKKGGKLLLKDSSYATIAEVRIEQERITTYNLEVAQLHTYLVGVDGAVVHNGYKDAKRGDIGIGRDGAPFSWLNPARCTTNKTLRKRHTETTKKPWPKEKNGKNEHVSHEVPLADGGPDHVGNVQPRTAADHAAEHNRNGDYARWGSN